MSRIITTAELEDRTTEELKTAFHKAQQDLAKSEPGSPERRNALASLENISRTMRGRPMPKPNRPGF